MWFITTGGSLYLAGSTGVVAAIFGAVDPKKFKKPEDSESKPKKCRWNSSQMSDSLVIVCLLLVLILMIAGLIVLSNDFVIDTPGGETGLPASALYSIVGITVVISIALVCWMVYTHCELGHCTREKEP